MAILRAGPFASSSGSFLDEPGSPNASILPVNCAMSDWVVDSWRAAERLRTASTDAIISYVDGPSVSTSFTLSSVGLSWSSAQLFFTYQAAEDTSLEMTYSVSASGQAAEARAQASVDDSSVLFDSDPSSVSGTVTIDLPATIIPKEVQVAIISFGTAGSGSLSIAP